MSCSVFGSASELGHINQLLALIQGGRQDRNPRAAKHNTQLFTLMRPSV